MSTDVVTPDAAVDAPPAGDREVAGAIVRVDDAAELRAVAREQGAVVALTALAALLPVAALPGECVLLPDDVPPPGGWARLGEVASDDGTLLAWRAAPGSAAPATEEDAAVRAADAAWRIGVAWVRTGLCERLAERAVERLRGRTVGGTATVNLPPVRLVLADAALAHLEAQALLDPALPGPELPGRGTAARLARVTAVLDRSSRAVHNLFGASGYVDGEATRLARTIDLLGHASGTLPGHDAGTAGGEEGQAA